MKSSRAANGRERRWTQTKDSAKNVNILDENWLDTLSDPSKSWLINFDVYEFAGWNIKTDSPF